VSEPDRLVELLRPASRILVFTGAGVSTGSGIPDFRGPNGLWKRRQPVYFDAFLASEEARVEYWDQKAAGWEGFRDARPNAAHRAIVRLEELGRLRALVTQNIDGLHQAAGTSAQRLIEVHGTNRRVECLDCGRLSDPEPAVARFRAERSTPTCTDCGGLMKFATVSFGQALAPGVLETAAAAAAGADLVLSLGSTLSVYPAASIPLIAARGGAPYVIINAGETDQDAEATLRLEGDVAEFLPPAVAALESA
jgi:NAD-dependent deacetylase